MRRRFFAAVGSVSSTKVRNKAETAAFDLHIGRVRPLFGPMMADQDNDRKKSFFRMRGRTVEVAGRSFDLPASRLARIAIGMLLILGGCFSILPVLGIWMLPLGFMVLSIDIPIVRRWRRRVDVKWSRWRIARRLRRQAAGSGHYRLRSIARSLAKDADLR